MILFITKHAFMSTTLSTKYEFKKIRLEAGNLTKN